MTEHRRSNHAVVTFDEYLGVDAEELDVPWAEFVGDRTSKATFGVGTDDPGDAYIELQTFDVESYDHEVVLNGRPLSGFDIPPSAGWQTWLDTVPADRLEEGENRLRIRRSATEEDAFVVGSVVIHWTEPV